METTIDLLNQFAGNGPDRMLAQHLQVSPTTISMARKNGRVSPELAAKLAREINLSKPEDVQIHEIQKWICIAVAEQMPQSKKEWLLDMIGCYRSDSIKNKLKKLTSV